MFFEIFKLLRVEKHKKFQKKHILRVVLPEESWILEIFFEALKFLCWEVALLADRNAHI